MESAWKRRRSGSPPLAFAILCACALFGHSTELSAVSLGAQVTESARVIEWRADYEREVRTICPRAETMIAAGESEERAARYAHAHRRVLGMKYKFYHGQTPADMLAAIRSRNIAKYGDPLGPRIDWLRARGRTWHQIIQSACAPGGADILPNLVAPLQASPFVAYSDKSCNHPKSNLGEP